MPDYKTINIEELDGFCILYLNRPDNFNALNYQLATDLYESLKYIDGKAELRCLIITGKGKAFCTGGDIIHFKKAEKPEQYMAQLAEKFHSALRFLKTLHFPTIAAINGFCFGAGLGLACTCDLRICSTDAKFGSAFTGVGLSPDSTLTYHLPKIVGLSLSNDMILTNRILSAEEALSFNLVSRIFESNDLLVAQGKDLARNLSQAATLALVKTRDMINSSYSNNFEAQINKEIKNIVESAGTIDFQEGIKAFLEKRKPIFKNS
jgi:2-(1,2-epoxy-1,2-dihydrophenyl)acetyl-CoA isomerase